ncbi:hypothetical protein BDV38DRAFT_276639 [Aspergillus pseudotamarii]|uniref:Uncharacterized protein n=1 Tax=Aspergillus pseudotamarii TaxID=132259 RepID=A0A5N6TB06_ASPPS|nr:uncharacterized protein BDV38DRAFT_276639 [Aspergillus pseudotamarii]KAE8143554.1 hypothetical protein BDV38DRAFT_276639 [Aspergillus pseudotamarii]
MVTTPQRYATFFTKSGCLCFGELHNLWSGSLAPIQGFPGIQPHRSGTVKAHHLEFNVPARNGRWQAFQLVDIETEMVSGWFLSHSDVDPDREIARILRVSGSPYEPDCGSTMNNEKTSAAGVLVINRYDWGYYDARGRDELNEQSDGPDRERRRVDVEASESVGVVDYAQAKSQVAAWKVQSPDGRRGGEAGVWMRIPMAEYKFGRFSFNDDRVAHSFLFFSGSTDFTRTSFVGHRRPLRKPETDVERFERRLREGFDFSGLQFLQMHSAPPDNADMISLCPPPPPESACIGPYPPGAHILRAQELDALRLHPFKPHVPPEIATSQGVCIETSASQTRPLAVFVDSWKDRVVDLINELILSYLERLVFPSVSFRTPSLIADALFGKPTAGKLLNIYCHCCLTQSGAEPIPHFDADYVSRKIKHFLESRVAGQFVTMEEESVGGIARVVAYLISEVLEVSSNAALCSRRYGIVPADIRITVYSDPELYDVFQYSTVLWKGRE